MNTDPAVALIKVFEGLRPKPYLCPAGIPTIGYGSTHYPDGRKVQLSDKPITYVEAHVLLMREVNSVCVPQVLKYCPNVSENVLNALVDFVYNLGSGSLKISTLRKRINSGDMVGAKSELPKWNKARVNGSMQALKGLTLRRQAECLLLN